MSGMPRIAYFATQGNGSSDEFRMAALLEGLNPRLVSFDRKHKIASGFGVFRFLRRDRPDLVVMEGSGFSGGLALIFARLFTRQRYVVSSGDPISVFIAWWHPILRPIALLYEVALYKFSAGFIGWSPYLVGRALTLGATRGITAENWSPAVPLGERSRARELLGIPGDAVVFGIVGSLQWNDRFDWCMGADLVRAVQRVDRDDVWVVVVGDGSGLDQLRKLSERRRARIVLVGRVPRTEVSKYLSAIDVGSLPHSSDPLGVFRYTTKISEYMASQVPVVTGVGPAAYDVGNDWMWRLPGEGPWDEVYVNKLSKLMAEISLDDIRCKKENVPQAILSFNRSAQTRRVYNFVTELLETQ